MIRELDDQMIDGADDHDHGFRFALLVEMILFRTRIMGSSLSRQGFAEAMLEAHLREFERHADHGEPVLFDRGFPDVVGFLDVSGLSVPKAVDQACRTLRYTGPILRAPAWAAIYVQDKERIQDWEQALASDEAVTAAWRRYGYDVTDFPLTDVEARLGFLRGLIYPAT